MFPLSGLLLRLSLLSLGLEDGGELRAAAINVTTVAIRRAFIVPLAAGIVGLVSSLFIRGELVWMNLYDVDIRRGLT